MVNFELMIVAVSFTLLAFGSTYFFAVVSSLKPNPMRPFSH